MPPTELDPAAILALFRPEGPWAKERGAKVRKRRLGLGLSTLELADRCGVSQPTIYRVESGVFVPSDRLRALLAYHLQTKPETLWQFPSRDELELISQAGVAS